MIARQMPTKASNVVIFLESNVPLLTLQKVGETAPNLIKSSAVEWNGLQNVG